MDKAKKVRNYYNQFSNDYDNFYQPIQYQKYQFFADELQKSNSSTLDLGGGTGLLSKYLNIPIINLDISFDMLKKAQVRDIHNISVAMDLSKLPIRSNAVDNIVSFTALQNIEFQQMAVNDILRIWTNKGYIIVTVLNKILKMDEFKQYWSHVTEGTEFCTLPVEDIAVLIH